MFSTLISCQPLLSLTKPKVPRKDTGPHEFNKATRPGSLHLLPRVTEPQHSAARMRKGKIRQGKAFLVKYKMHVFSPIINRTKPTH